MAKSTKSKSAAKKKSNGAAQEAVSAGITSVGVVASEKFPERRAADVDIADVDPGDGKGEHTPPLNAESFVVLDGKHKDVPKELDGAVAGVVDAPSVTEVDPETGQSHTFLPPKALIAVKELSQGQVFHLPMAAFKKISTHGRAGVQGFA